MHNNKQWIVVVVIAAVALTGWLIAGCGGGGGEPATGVSGRIVLLDNSEPLGGVTVTVAGQQSVSDDNGNFRVSGMPAGLWEVVATSGLWLQWGDPPEVVVVTGQTTALGLPILMITTGFEPPPTPTGP